MSRITQEKIALRIDISTICIDFISFIGRGARSVTLEKLLLSMQCFQMTFDERLNQRGCRVDGKTEYVEKYDFINIYRNLFDLKEAVIEDDTFMRAQPTLNNIKTPIAC